MDVIKPLEWYENKNTQNTARDTIINEIFPPGISHSARNFHHQIPEYRITPLKSLPHLALMQNLGGIWVKDESQRLNLNSFKVLGGSF
ncbi:MAG: diaminopropionate ammonia-lyase, partial [Calditrichaceae bacterium]